MSGAIPSAQSVTSIFESGHGTYAGRLPGELTLRRAERALADRAEEASEWAQSAARRLLVGACGIDRFAEAFAPFAERGEGALLEHAAAAYRARAQLLSNPRDPTPLVLRVGNGLQSDPAWVYRRIIAFAGLLATDAAVRRRPRLLMMMPCQNLSLLFVQVLQSLSQVEVECLLQRLLPWVWVWRQRLCAG